MDFFDNMDNTQKIIFGIAVITLVVAIIFFFSGKGEGMKKPEPKRVAQTDSAQAQPLRQETPIMDIPMQSEKVLVMFFAPWCGHCRNMEPTWEEFTQNFDGYNGVKILKIDGQENGQVAQIHGVSGFPTIKMCVRGLESPDGIVYEGDLTQFLLNHKP